MQELLPTAFPEWPQSERTEMDTLRNPLYGLSAASQQRRVFSMAFNLFTSCDGWLMKVTVQYKMYNDDQKAMVALKSPADTKDPLLGRVDTSQIPLPHTAMKLAEYICAEEGRPFGLDFDTDDAHGALVFGTMSSPEAFRLEDAVDLLSDKRPGRTSEQPVLLKVWYEGGVTFLSRSHVAHSVGYRYTSGFKIPGMGA